MVRRRDGHAGIFREDLCEELIEQPRDGIEFQLEGPEVVRHLSPWNYEVMKWRDRVEVAECDAELVVGSYSLRMDVAEDASVVYFHIAIGHAAEVAVIAVLLHGIARVAESMEIVRLVWTPAVARHDMINLERLVFGRDAAEFAAAARPSQYLVSKGAGYVSNGFTLV